MSRVLGATKRNSLVRICQESICFCWCFFQETLKITACRGKAVIDIVREGVQCAHRCLLLRRIS